MALAPELVRCVADGWKLGEAAHEKAKFSTISHLTGQIHAPIYRAHAARKAMILRAVLFLWHDENSR
jgi:hypothetical protein